MKNAELMVSLQTPNRKFRIFFMCQGHTMLQFLGQLAMINAPFAITDSPVSFGSIFKWDSMVLQEWSARNKKTFMFLCQDRKGAVSIMMASSKRQFVGILKL